MNNYLNQPGGATNKGPNKAAIARIFGIKDNEVSYLDKRLPIDGYKVLFDPTTQLCFWNTTATGTPTTWLVNNGILSLVTTIGSFTLNQANVKSTQISATQGGVIDDTLSKVVYVEQFEDLVEGTDWGPAFRAAVKYADKNSIPIVKFTGLRVISSPDTVQWIAPYDDGTISPDRIKAGTDATMTTETQVSFNVGINLPSGITLSGGIIDFQWDYQAGTIDDTQMIGIVGRVNSWDGTYAATTTGTNRTHGGGTWNLDCEIRNVMVAFIADGIAVNTEWGKVVIKRSLVPVIIMGTEACRWGNLSLVSCYAGVIFGGWWLQRNANNYPVSELPPYPASDINIAGWNDVNHFDYLYWSAAASTFNARFKAADAFFNTYFYKQFNQTKVGSTDAEGNAGTGRLSKYLSDGATDAYGTTGKSFNSVSIYRGVASRAFCLINRYGRWETGLYIHQMKTMGNHRSPILTNDSWAQNTGYVGMAYIERGCVVDSSNVWSTSNDWYSSGTDIWNSDITVCPGLVSQGAVSVQFPMNINSAQYPSNNKNPFIIPDATKITRNNTSAFGDDDNGFAPLFSVSTIDTSYNERFGLRVGQRGIKMAPVGFDTYPRATNEVLFKSRSFSQARATGKANLYSGTGTLLTTTTSLVTFSQERSVVRAWFSVDIPSTVSSNTGAAYLQLDTTELPTPSLSSGSYYPGPITQQIVIGSVACSVDIKGATIINNNGTYLIQFFSSQQKTAANIITWDKFTSAYPLRFELTYVSFWADE